MYCSAISICHSNRLMRATWWAMISSGGAHIVHDESMTVMTRQTSSYGLALGVVLLCICNNMVALGQETLPPLEDGRAPQTYDELWSGYDPRAEPLDIEVLHQWEEDGVTIQGAEKHAS